MVCQKCNSLLILKKEGLVCPSCSNMNRCLDKKGLKALTRQINWFHNAFSEIMSRYDKRRLFMWLFREREKISHQFFSEKPFIEINRFLSVNTLLKRVMSDFNIGGTELANEDNTKELIDLFEKVVNLVSDADAVKNGFAYVFEKEYLTNNEIETIDHLKIMGNYRAYRTENYVPILKTLNANMIMNQEEGEEYFQKHKKEYSMINGRKPKPIKQTTEEIIHQLYPFMRQFYYSLQSNRLFRKVISLDHLNKTNLKPMDFFTIAGNLHEANGEMNAIPKKEYVDFLKKCGIKISPDIFWKNLIYDGSDKEMYPFFASFENHVFISRYHTRLMSIFLFPIIHKNLFLKEHNKRSLVFEREEVKKEFQKYFDWCDGNFEDKKKSTLEIDLLAKRKSRLYVIECKFWNINKYLEEKSFHENLERDLKGIVNGIKYVKGKEVKKVSLIEKMDYIKSNTAEVEEKFGVDLSECKEIVGVVVTAIVPSTKSYKKIIFRGLTEIKDIGR